MQEKGINIIYFTPKSQFAEALRYVLRLVFLFLPFLNILPFRHEEIYFIVIISVLAVVAFFLFQIFFKSMFLPILGVKNEIIVTNEKIEITSKGKKQVWERTSEIKILQLLGESNRSKDLIQIQKEFKIIAKIEFSWVSSDSSKDFNLLMEEAKLSGKKR